MRRRLFKRSRMNDRDLMTLCDTFPVSMNVRARSFWLLCISKAGQSKCLLWNMLGSQSSLSKGKHANRSIEREKKKKKNPSSGNYLSVLHISVITSLLISSPERWWSTFTQLNIYQTSARSVSPAILSGQVPCRSCGAKRNAKVASWLTPYHAAVAAVWCRPTVTGPWRQAPMSCFASVRYSGCCSP